MKKQQQVFTLLPINTAWKHTYTPPAPVPTPERKPMPDNRRRNREIFLARMEGATFREIAEEYSLSVTSIQHMCAKYARRLKAYGNRDWNKMLDNLEKGLHPLTGLDVIFCNLSVAEHRDNFHEGRN